MKQSIINEVAKQYKDQYGKEMENLKRLVKEQGDEICQLRTDNRRLQNENDTLSNKVEQYEDWNRRLQEFLDLPEESRKEAIKQFKIQQDTNNRLHNLMKTFAPYMNALFGTY